MHAWRGKNPLVLDGLHRVQLFYSMAPNIISSNDGWNWTVTNNVFQNILSYTHAEGMIWQLDNNTLQNLNSIVDQGFSYNGTFLGRKIYLTIKILMTFIHKLMLPLHIKSLWFILLLAIRFLNSNYFFSNCLHWALFNFLTYCLNHIYTCCPRLTAV